jgi:hypothetical protein
LGGPHRSLIGERRLTLRRGRPADYESVAERCLGSNTGSLFTLDAVRRCQIVYHDTKPATNSAADPAMSVVSAISIISSV